MLGLEMGVPQRIQTVMASLIIVIATLTTMDILIPLRPLALSPLQG
jgi:hypothetical protein